MKTFKILVLDQQLGAQGIFVNVGRHLRLSVLGHQYWEKPEMLQAISGHKGELPTAEK